MDFLESMATSSRARCDAACTRRSYAEIERIAAAASAPSPLMLSHDGFDLIAEVKRSSPSAGQLAGADLSPVAQAASYAAAGVAAISVLTEPSRFDGELAHLESVSAEVAPVPAMRKDFLVAPYQVLEARASGASGVLLIAAMLDESALTDMLGVTLDLGMFALVEAFDEADIEKSAPIIDAAGPVFEAERCRMMMGVNCRDLRSLQVDFPRFDRLAKHLPPGMPWVAESGVTKPEQAAHVSALGYDLALVGTALMRADDPRNAANALLGAGRAAAPTG
ncbi:MAG: indole-3-glycerol-phosphate synthase [Gammaproteobacteria bacterium]|nr:indole-3-glycerol-phosphate synthase [Gammaproteobacteria bacterium]MBT8444813.1 indole-3-glycerol-phosphate synthase [Gammaproteobacteria bacterium]NND36497.1 indole-3-glycerol-phosphate synthase [Gammaproteobacteria bacterium]